MLVMRPVLIVKVMVTMAFVICCATPFCAPVGLGRIHGDGRRPASHLRPEWVLLDGSGPFRARVEATERVGELTYALATSPEGRHLVLRSLSPRTEGEEVRFTLTHQQLYGPGGVRWEGKGQGPGEEGGIT